MLILLLHFLLLSNSRYRILQFLRSKTHPPRPKVLTVAVYTLQMSSTAGIHVAIYNDGGVYKHWSLFVNGPTDAEQTVLHIMGSSTNYRFEMRASDARKSATLSELIYLCDVPIAKVTSIKEAARQAPIHNEYPGYNCQDYVLDLLDDLEGKRIINGNDANYKKKKEVVKSRQEGLA